MTLQEYGLKTIGQCAALIQTAINALVPDYQVEIGPEPTDIHIGDLVVLCPVIIQRRTIAVTNEQFGWRVSSREVVYYRPDDPPHYSDVVEGEDADLTKVARLVCNCLWNRKMDKYFAGSRIDILLEQMQLPPYRKAISENNVRWLLRNLVIVNRDKPAFQELMNLLEFEAKKHNWLNCTSYR